jgi:very-short-patch-repair endonuclease
MKSLVKVKCKLCGKEIERHPHRLKNGVRQFCCPEHRIEWMATVKGKEHWLYNHEKRICPQCGKEFEESPCRTKKFCSIECYAESKKLRGNCIICGKEVNRNGSKYCSRECMCIDRQSRIEKTCSICGRQFTIRPCEDRGDRNVCSKKCSDALKHERPQISDEEMAQYLISLKERIGRIPSLNDLRKETSVDKGALHWALYVRRGGLRYWQKKLFGKTTYCFTWEFSCTDTFNEVLGHPDFATQKTFKWLKNNDNDKTRAGSLRIDLFYPQYDLCIEFDGEGHFKQIDWKKGKNETLEVVQKRDRLKDELLKQHGLKLLRFRYDEPLTTEYVKKRLSQFIDFV